MEKNCLNCKYEPDWNKWVGAGDALRCSGMCKFKSVFPKLPPTTTINIKPIIRYVGDYGIYGRCPVWETK